jgi:large subunit ribosomal protein L16
MLQPKRVKYRKVQKGRIRGEAQSGNTLVFGEFGLQALEGGRLTSRQIEASRRAIVHNLRRGVMLWIRVFPDKPVTKKPAETRMGSGKGSLDHWVAVVRPGRVIFEIGGVNEEAAKGAFRLASHKLPMETKFMGKGA